MSAVRDGGNTSPTEDLEMLQKDMEALKFLRTPLEVPQYPLSAMRREVESLQRRPPVMSGPRLDPNQSERIARKMHDEAAEELNASRTAEKQRPKEIKKEAGARPVVVAMDTGARQSSLTSSVLRGGHTPLEGWLTGGESKATPQSVLEQSMERMALLMEGQQRQIAELQQMVVQQRKVAGKPKVIRIKSVASGLKVAKAPEAKAESKPAKDQEQERVGPRQDPPAGKKSHMYNLRERKGVKEVDREGSISEVEGDYWGETLSSEDSIEDEECSEYEETEAGVSELTAPSMGPGDGGNGEGGGED
jgi:hypothetical protein